MRKCKRAEGEWINQDYEESEEYMRIGKVDQIYIKESTLEQ